MAEDTEPSASPRPPLPRELFDITDLPDEKSDDFQTSIGSSPRILPTVHLSDGRLSSVPKQDDELVKNLRSTFVSLPPVKLSDDQLGSVPKQEDEDSKTLPTYISLGDKGTTASVTSGGDIIQINRFLGAGRSGFFCVDCDTNLPEPYIVQPRAAMLASMYGEPLGGLSFIIDSEPEDLPVALQDALALDAKPELVDNRWPRFTKETDHLTWVTTHFTRNSIVFERALFHAKQDPVAILSKNARLAFAPKTVLIREQEFLDPEYRFNEEDWDNSDNYAHFLGPHGYSIVIVHRGVVKGGPKMLAEDTSDTVALVISVCVNGQACQLEKDGEDAFPWYKLRLRNGETLETTSSEVVEMTCAYRLQLMPKKFDWKDCLIPVSEFLGIDSDSQGGLEPFRTIPFSRPRAPDPHLDYIIRRNLEHILSVCSIPVTRTPNAKEEEIAVAITCGDLSGHRIVTSASFFAFEFLLALSEHVRKYQSDQDHPRCDCGDDRAGCIKSAQVLYQRIEATCRGHLNWIKQAQKEDHSFAANYWASGDEIVFRDSSSHARDVLTPPSLTDTPFQLLKVTDFALRFDSSNDKQLAFDLLRPCVRHWMNNLKANNSRGFFAFPRPSSSGPGGIQSYRLEDHVWIWRTLHSIQRIGLELDPRKAQNSKEMIEARGKENEKDSAPHFSTTKFQTQILSRFTTENKTSRQRMLAVGRSALSNRFMFRSRDTALFYDENVHIFRKAPDLWKATVDAQRFHEENEDSRWGNPLRFALALIMASQKISINFRPAEKMLGVAKGILFQSSSINGLIPGQLNAETNEPEIYVDNSWRDFYWHVGFEVPLVLWKYLMEKKFERGSQREPTAQEPATSQPEFKMKKSMPLNNLIDEKSIVEIPDMWLYNSPDFLDYEPDMKSFLQTLKEAGVGVQLIDDPDSASGFQLDKATLRGIIIDVPKTQHMRGKRNLNQSAMDHPHPVTNSSMFDLLDTRRTPEKAKKRLIWLPNLDKETGLLCIVASTEGETTYLSEFLGRHGDRVKYLFDEATATANLWKTEFHLSSYKVGHNPKDGHMKFLGDDTKVLRTGAMGFRFVGDFFDRYWTCHVLEYDPEQDKDIWSPEAPQEILENFQEFIKPKRLHAVELEKRPWRQRKVLELMLLDRMLEQIVGRYKDILKQTGRQLKRLFPRASSTEANSADVTMVSNALFSKQLDSDEYSELTKIWPAFQYTLQVLEEDLEEILGKLELWDNREKERQPERPRWTNHDETKYRSAINKLTTSNNHRVRDLERFKGQIESLRARLESRLEATRNELSFQSAVDVQVFTYVTAIFLPLGFATGLFSMNGAPGGVTLWAMAITAVVTLALTLFLTMNTRNITWLYRRFTKHVKSRVTKDKPIAAEVETGGLEAKVAETLRTGTGEQIDGINVGGGGEGIPRGVLNGNTSGEGATSPGGTKHSKFRAPFAGLFKHDDKGAGGNQVDVSKLEKGGVDPR
jgi:hypothetical protein